jgi:hypothetical protein
MSANPASWIDEPEGTERARENLREARGGNGKGDPWPESYRIGELTLRYGYATATPQKLGTVVKGILHAGSVTLIYGPPKSGKSFLATDLAHTIAAAKKPMESTWMGHVIVRPGPVLYIACEGHAGFWKRDAAAAKRRGWDNETFPRGFILATGRPKLIKADENGFTYAPDPSAILAAVEHAKARSLDPVAIIVDTVFRSFGAGNVNASPDMNVYLAAIATLTDAGYAVALVHHEIKSGGTPAGSVSLIGGADTIIHVWRAETGEQRFWQVEMAKDDAETEPRAFTLEVVKLGLDLDGVEASSCVVIDKGAAPEATKKGRGRPADETSAEGIRASRILSVLRDVLADPAEGQPFSFPPLHQPMRVLTRARLKDAVIQAGIIAAPDPDADVNERKRVNKANNDVIYKATNRLTQQGKTKADAQFVGPVPG